jgi:DNA-binding response OmpR family regulator
MIDLTSPGRFSTLALDMATSILVVEDDPKIAEIVSKNLEAAGFECRAVHDGPAALAEFTRQNPSLIVLDVMLPGMDGLEITRRIRKDSRVPILLLTARSAESDKVLGFEIGADDYLTKPFSTVELVARVRALLRRSAYQEEEDVIERGELHIDVTQRVVQRGENAVELTSLEFDVLVMLAGHPGRVYSREALMRTVWGEDRIVDHRSIDSVVSRLRKKLEADPNHPVYIQTVWGAGYRFNPTE